MFESTQAKYLAYPSLVIVLLVIGNFIRMAVEGGAGVLSWVLTVVGFFFAALYLLLGIFNVNCLVMGGCSVWAWVVWFVAMLKLIVIIVLLIVALVTPRKKKDEQQATVAPATTTATTAPTTATTATTTVATPATPVTTTAVSAPTTTSA